LVSGSGTSVDPFILTSLSDLELIGQSGYALTAYYKLGSDIDASETQNPSYNEGAGWLPIQGEFKGSFDGDGHTISGLYINRPTTDNVGFMEHLRDNGTVKKLTISGEIIGQNNVGGISGNNYYGSILNCNFNGTVTGVGAVGGINGRSYPASILNTCVFTGTINGASEVGGIVGSYQVYHGSGNVINCQANGTINATGSYIGGILGHAWLGGKTLQDMSVTNLTFNCSATSDNVGGFAGQIYEGRLVNITVEANISGRNYIGGLVGYGYPFYGTEDCTFEGNVTGTAYVGGMCGYIEGHWSTYETLDCIVRGIITGTTNVGVIAGGSRDTHFKNFTINSADVTLVTTSTSDYVGGIAGSGYDVLFTNCHTNLDVSGRDYVGGICGRHYPAKGMTMCSSLGNISGRNYVGGLCGQYHIWSYSTSTTKLTLSYAGGTVTSATGERIGGLVGDLRGTIENSYAFGSVSGVLCVGGLVGNAYIGYLVTSYSRGAVAGTTSVGGLLGRNEGGSSATNSYWDTETSGQATSALGTPLTSDQMKCLGG
jgi:hypothetical protein